MFKVTEKGGVSEGWSGRKANKREEGREWMRTECVRVRRWLDLSRWELRVCEVRTLMSIMREAERKDTPLASQLGDL